MGGNATILDNLDRDQINAMLDNKYYEEDDFDDEELEDDDSADGPRRAEWG